LNEQISCVVLLILLVVGRVKGSTVYNFKQCYVLFWATQVCLAQYYKN